MKYDRTKIQKAINDLATLRNVSFYQPNIYNSLRLAEEILGEITVAMKNKEDSLEFEVKVIPDKE